MAEQAGGATGRGPARVEEARRAFAEWVREAGTRGRIFLQVRVTARESGRFEIRHREDSDAPPEQLARSADPYSAREIARTTKRGDHRPLKTAPNLRRGWALEAHNEADLHTVMDYLYPAAVAHWYAGRRGTLQVTHWEENAARQSGIYSAVGLLTPGAVRHTIEACCADPVCLRRVAWSIDAKLPRPAASPPEESADEARIPCPEACSLFISLARKVLQVEREPRRPVVGLGEVNDSELDQLRAIATAAADGTLTAVREGDFDDPRNPRRIRYLAARLRDAKPGEDGPC